METIQALLPYFRFRLAPIIESMVLLPCTITITISRQLTHFSYAFTFQALHYIICPALQYVLYSIYYTYVGTILVQSAKSSALLDVQ